MLWTTLREYDILLIRGDDQDYYQSVGMYVRVCVCAYPHAHTCLYKQALESLSFSLSLSVSLSITHTHTHSLYSTTKLYLLYLLVFKVIIGFLTIL